MKKLTIFYLPFLVILFLSCSPLRNIETEVLEPAEMSFPDEAYSMAFLFPEPDVRINTRTFDEIPAKPLEEFWSGMIDIASISPRFNVNSIKQLQRDTIRQDTLDWAQVNRLTDSLDIDVLGVMHQFQFSDSVEREIVYNYDYGGYYYVYEVHATIEWRIYDPQSRSIFNENKYKEKYVWEALAQDEREAIRNLIGINEAFSSAAYWSGNDAGCFMFPYWNETSRFYYVRGNKYLRRAKEYVENHEWQKAIDLWKVNFQYGDDELAYRTAHNIAFALEMLGKIDQSIKWAEKALNIVNRSRTREYLDTLKERKEKLEKVDKQMPI